MATIKPGALVSFSAEYGSLPAGIERGRIYSAKVVRALTDDECDPECQPMWRLQILGGAEIDAFDDECSINV